MFLVDKYNYLNYNNSNIEELIKTNYNFSKINFQHLIIHGKPGTNKNYIVNKILEKIYGKSIYNLKDIEYNISGYGNNRYSIKLKQSNNHIVIEPNNNGFDRYIVQEIIQNYAKIEILNIFENKSNFRIVVINKIDNLSYFAQASLRRTMEKYAKTCKFIFICDQLSKIIEPIRSRCVFFRIPLHTKFDIFNILLFISFKENINLSKDDYKSILEKSGNKLNNAIWLLELKKNKISDDQNWHLLIDSIINELNSSKSIFVILKKIREYLYLLFITNIKPQNILNEIMNKLINNIDDFNLKFSIINDTSIFESRLSIGTRFVIHLEAYIIKIYSLLKNYKLKSNNFNELEFN